VVTVTTGKRVSIVYTLFLPDKTRVETNVGEEPLTYTQGSNDIPAGLQKAVAGLRVGGRKRVTLSPENGFGPVDPAAFREVKKSTLPQDAHRVGAVMNARDKSSGRSHRIRVHKVKGKTVVLDFNHPLAGKTLVFDVKVVKVAAS
jgi:FKBP-type peptidyl-prolyl cis-trans isomerase SlyD